MQHPIERIALTGILLYLISIVIATAGALIETLVWALEARCSTELAIEIDNWLNTNCIYCLYRWLSIKLVCIVFIIKIK